MTALGAVLGLLAGALALAGAASAFGYVGAVGTNQAVALPGAAPDCTGTGCVGFGVVALAWAWVDDRLGYAVVCFALPPSGAGYFTGNDGSFVASAGASGSGCAWLSIAGMPAAGQDLHACAGMFGSALPEAIGRCF